MIAPVRFHVTLSGRPHELELRLPALGEALSLWMAPRLRTAERAAILAPAEIRRFVGHVNGQPPTELARAIAADPEARATYHTARNAALAQATEGGMLYAQCPHCRGWEADLIPLAVAVGLRVPFWPVSDATGGLALPALAGACDRPLRGARPASRLTFALPRADGTGTRAAFAGTGASERLASWQAHAERLFRESPDQAEDWEPESPGWHALLRFGAIVSEWPESAALSTLRGLASVSLADFLFVDNIYSLTHCVEQPADTRLNVTCQRCTGQFQPLAPSPTWPPLTLVPDPGWG